MPKIKRLFPGLPILFSLVLLASACNHTKSVQQPVATYNYTHTLTINGQKLSVEIASDDASRAQGLSGRSTLMDNQGMLFDFRNQGVVSPNFWMKDMLFNLDFIWIKNYRVVAVNSNVTKPESADFPPPLLPSPGPVDLVLEVSSGWSTSHNVKPGDLVKLDP